jgi:hypothetical protein
MQLTEDTVEGRVFVNMVMKFRCVKEGVFSARELISV